MARLNQIIAVEKGIKSQSFQELTDAHHALQKPSLLSGISRSYRPKDEEGEQLPPESTKVQVRAEEGRIPDAMPGSSYLIATAFTSLKVVSPCRHF